MKAPGSCADALFRNDSMFSQSGPERSFIPKEGAWNADWIWLDPDTYPEHQRCRRTAFCINEFPYTLALFRTAFALPFEPRKAEMWISADTRYVCRVNSSVVCRGPAEAGGDFGNTESPDWWFYDGLDVTGMMQQGENTVTAEVVMGPAALADVSMGQGGFLCELHVQGPESETLRIVSDETWRGLLCEAARSAFEYDARLEPAGWTLPSFDDTAWPRAQRLGPAHGCAWNLLPREIPVLMEVSVPAADAQPLPPSEAKRFDSIRNLAEPGAAVTIMPGPDVGFRLHFERELAGYLAFDVEGPEGLRIDVVFRETPDRDRGERETFIFPGRRWQHTTRYMHGFEYIDITAVFPEGSGQEPLSIHGIEALFTSFPVRYAGHFECSDPLLNHIWRIGRWTDQICMQSYHLDSPIHQEPPGDTGDYLIEALISYCSFGESRLARKDILRTAYLLKLKKHRMFTTSYSLIWIWMLYDYWMYTGDDAIVRQVLAQVHGLLRLFETYVGPESLVSNAPNYMFLDWVEAYGFSLHHPPASMGMGYMSAVYYRSLLRAAELTGLFGSKKKADIYKKRAAAVRDSFYENLLDPARGIFMDGLPGITGSEPYKWLPPDPDKATYTAHTNVMAAASGIIDPAFGEQVITNIMNDTSLPVMQPYFLHYFFEALAVTGMFDDHACDWMRKWKKLADEHPTSLKEKWDSGDYSHAWCGTPTFQMSARVLGITPAAPGFSEFSVQPRLGDLDSARGTVPAPRGPIAVSWNRTGDVLSGTLSAPPGSAARLFAEGITQRSVRCNGRAADTREEGGFTVWEVENGEYDIRIEFE